VRACRTWPRRRRRAGHGLVPTPGPLAPLPGRPSRRRPPKLRQPLGGGQRV
ncbi:MAG: hypothetical protein AVDCRST_MAG13-947, partial [uncultured Solirubrobacteraceae bacterium]